MLAALLPDCRRTTWPVGPVSRLGRGADLSRVPLLCGVDFDQRPRQAGRVVGAQDRPGSPGREAQDGESLKMSEVPKVS